MSSYDFSTYLSPLTWKYGSDEMRRIFSEENKLRLWRKVWVALARVQHEAGLVSKKELSDMVAHETTFSVERAVELEKEIHHDIMGAVKEFGEKAKIAAGKIHLGATSMDIAENTDMIRLKEALTLIRGKLVTLLQTFADQIETYARTACIGFTHLQTAEPTTVGYRLALYGQDLFNDLALLDFVAGHIKAKGMKGATGTAASYGTLLQGKKMTAAVFDRKVMRHLGIEGALITSQTYPRKFDLWILTVVSSIAQSLSKFAADLRILQMPPIGEWSEPFGKKQVGSSAMPFKKNPVNAERICGLARYVSHLPTIAWENAAHTYLERTLDDYIANRRTILAEGFLATDEMIMDTQKIISRLVVNKIRISFNLSKYGPFAATEAVLMAAVKNGGDRQKLHEVLRELSLAAWSKVADGQTNPLPELLENSQELRKYVPKPEIQKLLDASAHIGDAPERAMKLVRRIRSTVK